MSAGDRRPHSRLPPPSALGRYRHWLDREIPGLLERQPAALLGRRAFRRVRWDFAGTRELPADRPAPSTAPQRALLANSLGSDSLTSLLLAREMGLELTLAHYRELAVPAEGRASDELFAACESVTGLSTAIVDCDLHEPCRSHRWKRWATQPSAVLMVPRLCLLLLPFALHARAGTILVGCELDMAYETPLPPFGLTHERWLQSPQGVAELDQWIGELTDGRVRVTTVLGSVHDIAKLRLLHGGDAALGRLSRSCWWGTGGRRWCGWCWNCSHKYLHLVAQGIDPASCGFDASPFDREVAQRHYVLFAGGRSPGHRVYRDQELLAFLETARRGAAGWAVDRFSRRLRADAERREAELRRRYLQPEDSLFRGVHLYTAALDAARRLLAALPDELRLGPPDPDGSR